jgi:hypothetical protein
VATASAAKRGKLKSSRKQLEHKQEWANTDNEDHEELKILKCR